MHCLPPHWGAAQLWSLKSEFSISAPKQVQPIFVWGAYHLTQTHRWFQTRQDPQSHHERSSRKWAELNRDQRWPPPEGGCACCLQFLTHSALHPCNGTFILFTLPELHSDSYLWSCNHKTPNFFICPQVSLWHLTVWSVWWASHLKILLPSLMTLPSRLSSFCDHSVAKIFLFFLSWNERPPHRKSEDWKHAFTQGWRKASTKYSAKQRIQILEMRTDIE